MSTKEFQAHDDALTALNQARERVKETRKNFVTHVRKTGVRIRKELLRGGNDLIAINCTLTDSRLEEVSMSVDVISKGDVTKTDITVVCDWLRKNGWRITDDVEVTSSAIGRGRFFLTCV